MKISAIKKELSYLLETPIKSAKDLRVAAETGAKLAEVMEAWSFLNYKEEYSWNVLLNKLVPDIFILLQAKEYLLVNWHCNESDLIMGHTFIELKHGYQILGVINLTLNGLTCRSFNGEALLEDLNMLVEIVQGEGADEETSTYGGEGTVATVKDETVINEETTYKGIPWDHLTKTEYQNSNYILWYAPPKEDELTITSNSRFYSVRYNGMKVSRTSLVEFIPVIKQWVGIN